MKVGDMVWWHHDNDCVCYPAIVVGVTDDGWMVIDTPEGQPIGTVRENWVNDSPCPECRAALLRWAGTVPWREIATANVEEKP